MPYSVFPNTVGNTIISIIFHFLLMNPINSLISTVANIAVNLVCDIRWNKEHKTEKNILCHLGQSDELYVFELSK